MTAAKMPHPEHAKHLCYLNNMGVQLSKPAEYKALVKDAKFMCGICGRAAAKSSNLCKPIKL